MRWTDDPRFNTRYTWFLAAFFAAGIALTAWAHMAPEAGDLVRIEGRLERVREVKFGGKSKTRAFELLIASRGGDNEILYLHEASVYDRARNIYDISKYQSLVGRTVIAHRPPSGWSINSLYDKRVLAFSTGDQVLLSYADATRSERRYRWWLGGLAACGLLLALVWSLLLSSAVASRLGGPRALH